ncbi:MAG: DUF3367 domain-containing protein [Nocardioidaceae bacterium]|nr:DUF3367 domain-containing protein [Nocardioidaceae bacterium]MCB8993698.1 DUF3367 domain-containing protein [Nocardioidaceae bacterium]MCO5324366.1 alpha-(1->3)-arabinofuranosyltransferase [Nocardioidaceae bacterium]
MESGDRAPEAVNAAPATASGRSKSAIRLITGCVFMVAVAFVQSPGKLVADTKFDLAIDPAGFLGQALHLWDPTAAFGQIQNQAYGYFWPMGPLFLLGHEIGLPGWVIQRAWLALVMVVAFLGAALVARALGIRRDAAVILAGFTYALSPRMITDLGPHSIEVWPMALAPWVLLPLIVGSRRGSPRQAAALSALAIGMIGGVNAAAASAVLPMGVLWLLTRTRGKRRRIMMIWWPVFTALATLWWLVPLFILGRYSPPFLDYIETARVTTLSTGIFDSLRGTSNWVPYIDSLARGGNDLITAFYAPLNSGVILMFAVLGLLMPRMPERRFLLASLLSGLVLLSSSHLGALQGWFASDLNHMLDGALSALRNVHKFDPIVRLPMVISLAWVFEQSLVIGEASLGRLADGARWRRATRVGAAYAIPILIGITAVGAAAPAFMMRITPAGEVTEVPGYWREATAWLQKQDPTGTTLLAPGSSFATYMWGNPRDEPVQFVSSAPWAVRNSIPLAPPDNIRMLNEVQERFVQGRGSAGMADYLRRAGIRFILLRNDLQRAPGLVDPILTHQALAQSPGITKVKTFGPGVGGEPFLDSNGNRVVINQGWQSIYSALEIYEVQGGGGQFVQSDSAPVVAGGVESLLALADRGVLQDQPTILAHDLPRSSQSPGSVILTDSQRARVREIGSLNDAYSYVLAPGEAKRFADPRDYLSASATQWQTRARYEGVASLTVSSSMSDSGSDLGRGPSAALDGNLSTSWESVVLDSEPWLRIGLEEPLELHEVTLTTPEDSPDPQLVSVQTQGQLTKQVKLRAGVPMTVSLDGAKTSWVKIRGESNNGLPMSLAEVAVPGMTFQRVLTLPALPSGWGAPAAISFEAALDRTPVCASVDLATRCLHRPSTSGEEDFGFAREFSIGQGADYDLEIAGQPRGGPALDALIQKDRLISVLADSTMVTDPRGSALAAIDGDPGTTWIAAPTTKRPTFIISWLGKRLITGIKLSLQDGAAARMPDAVTLSWPGGNREVELTDGAASFAPIRTNQLVMRLSSRERAFGLDFDLHQRGLGIGIGELNLTGLPGLPATPSQAVVDYGCGSGPSLKLGDQEVDTALMASDADLFALKQTPLRLCGASNLTVASGTTTVTSVSTPEVAVSSLLLRQSDWSAQAVQEISGSVGHSGQSFRMHPTTTEGMVVHRANANPGWQAKQGDQELESVVADGWQQAWRVQNGSPVAVSFVPDSSYRWGLASGAFAFGALVVVILLQIRRRPDAKLPPVPAAVGRRMLDGILAVLAVGLVGGWIGIAAAGVGVMIYRGAARIMPSALVPWVAALPVFVAALGYALMPWGSAEGWFGDKLLPAFLVMVALGAVMAAVVIPQRPSQGNAV